MSKPDITVKGSINNSVIVTDGKGCKALASAVARMVAVLMVIVAVAVIAVLILR